jgi:hypothetical protein
MQSVNRLLAANSGNNVAVRGDYVWLKSATGNVQIKTDRGDVLVLNDGEYARVDKKFTEFFVLDLSGAQNDITMIVAEGGDAGRYGGSVTISNPSTIGDVVDVPVTAGVATLLLAANSLRSEAIITSLDTNTNTTRIGSSSVTAARGIPLPVGGSLTLATTGAIYGFNVAAETFSVSYTEF